MYWIAKLIIIYLLATLLWSAPRTTGQKPVPREGASLVTYCAANLKDTHNVDMHDQLLLFGGRSADLTCFNDVHTFSLRKWLYVSIIILAQYSGSYFLLAI
jgi:hypothetical protein